VGPRALVVIPTYKESADIETVRRRVRRAAPDVDFLVVDDNSPTRRPRSPNESFASSRASASCGGPQDGPGRGVPCRLRVRHAHRYDVLLEMDADLRSLLRRRRSASWARFLRC